MKKRAHRTIFLILLVLAIIIILFLYYSNVLSGPFTGQYPGTCSGTTCPVSVPGQFGNALDFDGVGDFVTLGTPDIVANDGVSSVNKMSIVAWIYIDAFNGNDARIISKAVGSAEQDHYWMLSQFQDTSLRVRLKTNGVTTALFSSSGILNTGEWMHVAATYDGNMMRLYKNAQEIASVAKTGNIDRNSNIQAYIGNNPVTMVQGFNGKIDDLAIYNRAVTQSEILGIMTNGVGGGVIGGTGSSVCGNGVLEGAEQCDNGIGNGNVCTASYGGSCNYCSENCATITVQGPYCGDGIVQGPLEQCEGSTISPNTCTANGGYTGTQTCVAGTCTFGACVSNQFCGDGICNGLETASTCPADCQATTITITLRPINNGVYNQWLSLGCSSSQRWQCVDEQLPNIEDYIFTDGKKKKISFEMIDTGLTSGTINYIKVYYYAKQYTSSRKTIQPLLRIGSTDYLGNLFTLNANYGYYSQTYTTNPATGQPWTLQALDNLQLGVQSHAGNPGGYVAQMYVEINLNI